MPIQALWVEDEQESMIWEQTKAEALGWEITRAKSMELALELLNSQTFDVVIVDIIMSTSKYLAGQGLVDQDTGLQLLARLRTSDWQGATPSDVRVVVISCVDSPGKRNAMVKHVGGERYVLGKDTFTEADYLSLLQEVTREVSHGSGTNS